MANDEVQQLPPDYASDALPPPVANPSYVQQYRYPQTGYASASTSAKNAYVPPSQTQWSQAPAASTPAASTPAHAARALAASTLAAFNSTAVQDDDQDASNDGYTTPGIPKEHLNVSFVYTLYYCYSCDCHFTFRLILRSVFKSTKALELLNQSRRRLG